MINSALKNLALPTLIGAALGSMLGISCIFPDYVISGAMAFFVIVCFFLLLARKDRLPVSYIFWCLGVLFHLIAMWWIGPTIARFGGFGESIGTLLLLLYSGLSALQFYLSASAAQKLEKFRIDPHFGFVFTWMIMEIIFPRLFPWGLGDFFISWTYLASLAEWFGSRGCSLIVLFLALVLTRILLSLLQNRSVKWQIVLFVCFLCVNLGTGAFLHIRTLNELSSGASLKALVVQGNLDIYKKGNQSFLEANIETYRRLTREALASEVGKNADVDFIIWPESVMNRWTPNFLREYPDDRMDPYPDAPLPLLYGVISYYLASGSPESSAERYNGAIVRGVRGNIESFYGKRILMPFGEYVPFANIFPWMNNLVPIGGGFSSGKVDKPIRISLADKFLNAGILICYEDLSSDLSRQYVASGAEILINLTNDAWYGDSPAPYQHDLLARFRAIETRKTLIRSTNTGLTSLVLPTGALEKTMPLFEESSEVFEFATNQRKTLYVKWGDLALYVILGIYGLGLLVKRKD